MLDKQSKNQRILSIYVRLCEGKTIHKAAEAEYFGVDARSIQRDIDDIRAFLDDRQTKKGTDNRSIVYDRIKKGYVLTGAEGSMMTNSEILAVSKILLESRAFTKKEIDVILEKLVNGCAPLKNMQLVNELISNEKYHYVELHHKEYIQDKLWHIGVDIKEHNLMEMQYLKADTSQEAVKRVIEPVALLFSEYYFYLNAFIVEKDEAGKYVHKYDYPAIFRIDRIKSYKDTGEKFRITYADRFEEGEFRKRIQFMYAGRLMNIRLRYTGKSPEAILDRLPTARITGKDKEGCLIEAEVYGNGIIMWLLSQGTQIEVLEPEALRKKMKETIKKMAEKYQ